MFDQYVSPWLEIADDGRSRRPSIGSQALGATAIAGCHTPVIGAGHVAQAHRATRASRAAVVPPQPDQAVLGQIQRALSPGAAA